MAIALDNASANQSGTGTTLTYSKTNTGSNLYLVVWAKVTGSATATCTYNGVSMTQAIGQVIDISSTIRLYAWTLANPDTGANNVVITTSGSVFVLSNAQSYTGAQQTNTPEVASYVQKIGGSAVALFISLTSTNAGAWIAATQVDSLIDPTSAYQGTLRGGTFASDLATVDSNGAVGAGSHDIGWNYSSANTADIIGISFAPTATPPKSGFLMFM